MINIFDAQREFDQDPNPMTAHRLSIALRRAGITGRADTFELLGRIMAHDVTPSMKDDLFDHVMKQTSWFFYKDVYVKEIKSAITRIVNRLIKLNLDLYIMNAERQQIRLWQSDPNLEEHTATVHERDALSRELAGMLILLFKMDPGSFPVDISELTEGLEYQPFELQGGDVVEIPIRATNFTGALSVIYSEPAYEWPNSVQLEGMPRLHHMLNHRIYTYLRVIGEDPDDFASNPDWGEVAYFYSDPMDVYQGYSLSDEVDDHPSVAVVVDLIRHLQYNPGAGFVMESRSNGTLRVDLETPQEWGITRRRYWPSCTNCGELVNPADDECDECESPVEEQ